MPDLINEAPCVCGHSYADHDELEPGVMGACLQLVGEGRDFADDCPCMGYEAQRGPALVHEPLGPTTCPLCYSVATTNLAVTQWLCPRCGCTWQPGERTTTPLPAELDPRIKAVLPVAPGSALVVHLAATDQAHALEGYANELVDALPEGCNVVFVYGADTNLRTMPVTMADVVAAVQGAALDVLSESIDHDAATAMAEAVLLLLASRGAWRHAE